MIERNFIPAYRWETGSPRKRCYNDMKIKPKARDTMPMCVSVRWDGKTYLDHVEDRLGDLTDFEQEELEQLEEGVWTYPDATNGKPWYVIKVDGKKDEFSYFSIAKERYFPGLNTWN